MISNLDRKVNTSHFASTPRECAHEFPKSLKPFRSDSFTISRSLGYLKGEQIEHDEAFDLILDSPSSNAPSKHRLRAVLCKYSSLWLIEQHFVERSGIFYIWLQDRKQLEKGQKDGFTPPPPPYFHSCGEYPAKDKFHNLRKKGSKVYLPQFSLVFGFPQVVCKRVKSTFKLKTKSMTMSRLMR